MVAILYPPFILEFASPNSLLFIVPPTKALVHHDGRFEPLMCILGISNDWFHAIQLHETLLDRRPVFSYGGCWSNAKSGGPLA